MDAPSSERQPIGALQVSPCTGTNPSVIPASFGQAAPKVHHAFSHFAQKLGYPDSGIVAAQLPCNICGSYWRSKPNISFSLGSVTGSPHYTEHSYRCQLSRSTVAATIAMGRNDANVYENRYPLMLRLSLPFLILSYLTVLARLFARKYMKVPLAADDFMILIASVKARQAFL